MSTLFTQEQKQANLRTLVKEKDDMENEIMDITDLLENMPGNPGVSGKLIDEEGFPRKDLDIFEIRKLRNRLAHLQTDHVNLMKRIEQGLFDLHSEYKNEEVKTGVTLQQDKGNIEKQSQSSSSQNLVKKNQEVKIPFAWISDVIQDSPAAQAGMMIGDAIYEFGPINHSNHDNLQGIVNLVKQNLNFAIQVKILRKDLMGSPQSIDLQFVPREWGGRGFLGCALKLNPV